MKTFSIEANNLTPEIREAINNQEPGLYLIYGVFLHDNALALNRLHKGQLTDIQILLQEQDVSEVQTLYQIPVPEFIVQQNDEEYAKFVQIHLLRQQELMLHDAQGNALRDEQGQPKLKSDEELMQEFIQLFTTRLAAVDVEESVADTTDLESTEENLDLFQADEDESAG